MQDDCGLQITKEEFEKLPDSNKLGVIYDCVNYNTKLTQELQKRKKLDATLTASGGVVGGFVAFLVSKIFKI